MKRFAAVLLMVCLMATGLFAVQAHADSSASKAEIYCTVNPEGDCLYSLTVNFHMETSDKELTFPLPGNAKDITLNGGSVGTSSRGGIIYANVGSATGGMVGDFTVRFDYTVPKAVKVNADRQLQLDMPLLSGFAYPVNTLSFVITLPGNVVTTPNFVSTYQLNGFESKLELVIKDNMITGITKASLNDHEAVNMSMIVPKEMFPSVSTYQREGNPELYPMIGVGVAALLYWLLFLRTLPPVKIRSTVPPAGISAGELGCRMTMSGGDLTMMVLTWAQMGYLLIHLDGNGRVLLHKRMDMGNERSLFEVRVFSTLFGNRRVVDCSAIQYAKACRRTANMIPGEKTMAKGSFGNRKTFRILFCIVHVFCAVCVAMNMTDIVALEVLFSIVFGVLAIITAWKMQDAAFCIHTRSHLRIWIALGCFAIWVVLGIICHQIWIPLGSAAAQILAGFMTAYGGRRTGLNRTEAGEILGLRSYLRSIPRPEALRMQKIDPDFFFRMAPYAIALGVGKPFAAAFGKKKLDQCPYFVTRIHGKRTAEEWMRLMTQAVSAMDERYRRMELEKWMAVRIR